MFYHIVGWIKPTVYTYTDHQYADNGNSQLTFRISEQPAFGIYHLPKWGNMFSPEGWEVILLIGAVQEVKITDSKSQIFQTFFISFIATVRNTLLVFLQFSCVIFTIFLNLGSSHHPFILTPPSFNIFQEVLPIPDFSLEFLIFIKSILQQFSADSIHESMFDDRELMESAMQSTVMANLESCSSPFWTSSEID